MVCGENGERFHDGGSYGLPSGFYHHSGFGQSVRNRRFQRHFQSAGTQRERPGTEDLRVQSVRRPHGSHSLRGGNLFCKAFSDPYDRRQRRFLCLHLQLHVLDDGGRRDPDAGQCLVRTSGPVDRRCEGSRIRNVHGRHPQHHSGSALHVRAPAARYGGHGRGDRNLSVQYDRPDLLPGVPVQTQGQSGVHVLTGRYYTEAGYPGRSFLDRNRRRTADVFGNGVQHICQ